MIPPRNVMSLPARICTQISASELLLRSRSSAPAEGGAQTGHRAAMSYPGLVGHTDHPKASGEELFDQIIFFVVERGAAEMAKRGGVIDCRTVFLPNECAFARFPNTIGHHVHRAIELNFRPLFRARRAIFYFRLASGMGEQLIRCRALRTKITLADRAFRITFDGDQ